MVTLVAVHPNPNVVPEIYFVDKKEAFTRCQELVGGYIERIQVMYEGKKRDCWMDEEGLLKMLEPNIRIMEIDCDKGYRGGMPLVGTGVIWIP
jgi:hypothetical protein